MKSDSEDMSVRSTLDVITTKEKQKIAEAESRP
jgi:hypothetical protein